MKVPLSWVREFVDVTASAADIGTLMSVRGLALEGLEPHGDDVVMDFDVTANRPDCLSVMGIAREIAAAYGRGFDGRSHEGSHEGSHDRSHDRSHGGVIPVAIEAPDLCARYVGAVAEVTVGPSPAWMQARLLACGIRPISNIVDITNYVLLELGQPLHAFDLDRLGGGAIVVRRARAGETLTTLDGKARTLGPDMLVIADAARAQALGGVMGGAESEVTNATTRIVFEAAWFKPASVRATSRALGLRTEASMRFERGLDVTAPARAMARACELLEQIGAGRATGAVTDAYPTPFRPKTLRLEQRRITGLLGMDVPGAAVTRILTALGCQVQPATGGWDVTVPAWRVDLNRPVDLVEEVGRHHGFEHLPATFPGVEQAPPPSDPRIARDRKARSALLGMGFSEAITFAFIEQAAAEAFIEAGNGAVALANPLSEKFSVMRPGLLPGLIDAVSHNRRHGRPDVRLFEIGTRFSLAGETRAAALAWTGLATPDHWSGGRRTVDFADVKGVVEVVLSVFFGTLTGVPYEVVEIERPFLVPGRAAAARVNGATIAVFGQLRPAVAEARDLPAADDIYVAEIDLDALSAAAPGETLRTAPLPRYPSVVRDVSILVADSLSAATVRGTIRSAAPDTLVQVREFDRYQGKGVPEGNVSLSYRLTFQSPERTLTDQEVSDAMTQIVDALKRSHHAEQR
jgi:phenylalanyl-tRNA synthetase beta chain